MPGRQMGLRYDWARIANLKPGWNGYDAPPPSGLAIRLATAFVEALDAARYSANRVVPSAVGGVAVVKRCGARKAYVEFSNDGRILMLLSDGDAEPTITAVSSDDHAAALAAMRAYLSN